MIWPIEPWAFNNQRCDGENHSREGRVSKKQATDEEKWLRMDPNTQVFIDCSQSNTCSFVITSSWSQIVQAFHGTWGQRVQRMKKMPCLEGDPLSGKWRSKLWSWALTVGATPGVVASTLKKWLGFLLSKTEIKSNVPWKLSSLPLSLLLWFWMPLVCIAQSQSMMDWGNSSSTGMTASGLQLVIDTHITPETGF